MAAGGNKRKSKDLGEKLNGVKTNEGKLHKKNWGKCLENASFWGLNSKKFRGGSSET